MPRRKSICNFPSADRSFLVMLMAKNATAITTRSGYEGNNIIWTAEYSRLRWILCHSFKTRFRIFRCIWFASLVIPGHIAFVLVGGGWETCVAGCVSAWGVLCKFIDKDLIYDICRREMKVLLGWHQPPSRASDPKMELSKNWNNNEVSRYARDRN